MGLEKVALVSLENNLFNETPSYSIYRNGNPVLLVELCCFVGSKYKWQWLVYSWLTRYYSYSSYFVILKKHLFIFLMHLNIFEEPKTFICCSTFNHMLYCIRYFSVQKNYAGIYHPINMIWLLIWFLNEIINLSSQG